MIFVLIKQKLLTAQLPIVHYQQHITKAIRKFSLLFRYAKLQACVIIITQFIAHN